MHGHWMACRKKCQGCNGIDHVGEPCVFQSEDFYRQNTCRSIIYGRRAQADESYDSGSHEEYHYGTEDPQAQYDDDGNFDHGYEDYNDEGYEDEGYQDWYNDLGDDDTYYIDDPPVSDGNLGMDEALAEIEILRENLTASREQIDRSEEQHRQTRAADQEELDRLRTLLQQSFDREAFQKHRAELAERSEQRLGKQLRDLEDRLERHGRQQRRAERAEAEEQRLSEDVQHLTDMLDEAEERLERCSCPRRRGRRHRHHG
ncbi:hypothetical protein IWZ01DRAFT_479933 [Phyllosticta capitalensis]